MPKIRKDLTGLVFGRLTVISYAFQNGGNFYWNCVCSCGIVCTRVGSNLKRNSKSCGCLARELTKARNTTHGESHTREFAAWTRMKSRCYNSNNQKVYKNYGGRGITVCDRWLHSYENFLSDMGRMTAEKYTLERVDSNGNYEPGNCKWATMYEQQNNRRDNVRITHEGRTQNLSQWCREFGLNFWTVNRRINKYGFDPVIALTAPIRKHNT